MGIRREKNYRVSCDSGVSRDCATGAGAGYLVKEAIDKDHLAATLRQQGWLAEWERCYDRRYYENDIGKMDLVLTCPQCFAEQCKPQEEYSSPDLKVDYKPRGETELKAAVEAKREELKSPEKSPFEDLIDDGPDAICDDCGHFACRHWQEKCLFGALVPNYPECQCKGMLWKGVRFEMDPTGGPIKEITQ